MFVIPGRRHNDSINNIFLLFVVLKFVIIYRSWIWLLLLLLLEPTEAKEENIRSCSVVHTDNIGLANDSQISRMQQNCGKQTYVACPKGTSTTFAVLRFGSRAFCFPLPDDG
ncbi:hypothetical protein EDB19DRAFT_207451 [Suillus lakei]|nr:hypothetical protein EDB19DRAFT_207451 [Suillus lakei]